MNIKAVSEPCLRMSNIYNGNFKKTFYGFAKAMIRNFV